MGMKGRILAVLAGAAIVAGIAVTAAFGAHRAATRASPPRRSRSAARSRSPGRRRSTGRSRRPRRRTSTTSTTTAASTGARSTSRSSTTAYDPSKTVPLAQQLVEQDKVFAVFGSLGTAPTLATWSYLNSRKVPQVLLATGDSYWGFSYKKYPWTIGWQPDYPGEAQALRQVHRSEHAEREDRRPLPERRLRQELLRRPARRPRREEGQHRRRRVVRRHEPEPSRSRSSR